MTLKVHQVCRKFFLVLFLIVVISVTYILARIADNNRYDIELGRYVPPFSQVVAIWGLVSCGLSLLAVPLFIACHVRVKFETIYMTLLAILWMAEAIMASVYRSLRDDERLRNCDNGTARFCRYIAVIEALSFVLFITALLYVFAVCFYALGSRQWGKESVERSSMPTWHSIFFEQPQPTGQVVVVHAPAATEGHAQSVRISAPPMFTDCQCGHLVQHSHPDVQSVSDDHDTKSPV